MPRLEITGTGGFEKVIYLEEEEPVSIGRAPENTLTEGGSALSRKHATITLSEGIVILRDLNSSNGSFLNGEEINRPHVLETGDVVTCGELELTYFED
ncbi:MAG: FHA domain-containing protein [Myxococcota bacterium]|jgi:pSer/pThr/pTyr-binding forkhead associated (FHA) protein|nr:FHA domain-containing protein [Myxococcota bacterium]